MIERGEYVRQVESYLCRKNRGHLIRVVGPAFELVSGWAALGLPLKVAFRGIDRCCERLEARGARRRPVRIEFCEADVLDAFDSWRRAVGVTEGQESGGDAPAAAPARKAALAAHIERAIARLAHARGRSGAAPVLQGEIDRIIRALEGLAGVAAGARGESRATVIVQLAEEDARLTAAVMSSLTAERLDRFRSEAAAELAPFGGRMPPDARASALAAALERLVREAHELPILRYE